MRLLPPGIPSAFSAFLLASLLAGCNPSEEGTTTMRNSEPYEVESEPTTRTQNDSIDNTADSTALDDEDREDREPLNRQDREPIGQ